MTHSEKPRYQLSVKLCIVALLGLLSFLPLGLVRSLILERQQSQEAVSQQIAAGTARAQVLEGPVVVLPYTLRGVESSTVNGKAVPQEHVEAGRLVMLPENLSATNQIKVDSRKVSLYKSLSITNEAAFSARFAFAPDWVARTLAGRQAKIEFGVGKMVIGIIDPRGLQNQPRVVWAGQTIDFVPASNGKTLEAELGDISALVTTPIEAKYSVSLRATQNTQFGLTGKESTLTVASDWPHPGFIGAALPEKHSITEDGFTATWKRSHFNSNAQTHYSNCLPGGDCGNMKPELVGVSFVQPVDLYQQLERSAKYGILFVGLTFLAFLLFEIFKRLRVHPVQYSLVAVALAMFYLLLTSLSEHIAFVWAYVSAASACVLLIGVYVGYVLKSAWRGLGFTALLAGLYATLFVILRAEDHALLMGSIMLFVILSAVMLGTRKVDWYALGRDDTAPQVAPAQ